MIYIPVFNVTKYIYYSDPISKFCFYLTHQDSPKRAFSSTLFFDTCIFSLNSTINDSRVVLHTTNLLIMLPRSSNHVYTLSKPFFSKITTDDCVPPYTFPASVCSFSSFMSILDLLSRSAPSTPPLLKKGCHSQCVHISV